MFTVYQRKLPHWRADAATYFVTWRIDRARPDLDPAERDLVSLALRHFDGERYELLAYVVMNDHVHVVVTPRPGRNLEQIVHSWKSYSAHRLRAGRSGRVWQPEYYDRIIRNEAELSQKIEYTLGNPFTRWPDLTEYPWVWTRWADDA